MEETRRCSDCLELKSLDAFYVKRPNKRQSVCKGCNKVQAHKRYWANKEYTLSKGKEWRLKNKEKASQINKIWRTLNKSRKAATGKAYRRANKERIARRVKNWAKQNTAKRAASTAKRRAKHSKASPTWMTYKEFLQIERFYVLAEKLEKLFCKRYDVDHIIPLQGETVCGLHVPWNLRVISARLNQVKGNKLFQNEIELRKIYERS
jgi:hypothetical protein